MTRMHATHYAALLLLTGMQFLLPSTSFASSPYRPPAPEAGLLLGSTFNPGQWDLQAVENGPDSPSFLIPQLGVRGAWWMASSFAIHGELSYMPHMSAHTPGLNHAMSWRTGVLCIPFPHAWAFTPLFDVGLGAYHNVAGPRGADLDFRYDVGTGVRRNLKSKQHMFVQLDVRQVFTDGPLPSDVSRNIEVLTSLQFKLRDRPRDIAQDIRSVRARDSNRTFAPRHDVDRDGINDSQDLCPRQPGKSEFSGCPDIDEDGTPDHQDQCPTYPEDRDGFEDTDGCPDPDNDRDGGAGHTRQMSGPSRERLQH